MAHVRSNIKYFHFTYLQDFMRWIVKICRDLPFPHFSKFAIYKIPRCPNKTFEIGLFTFSGIVNLLCGARQVKERIWQKCSLSAEKQRLTFMGQHLEDDNKTLKECHIHHKDMIVCQKYIVGKGGQRPNDEDDGGFWADWEDDL